MKVKEAKRLFNADVIAPDEILLEPCDVLAPCAVGGVITPALVPKLACKAVCGSANNILSNSSVSNDLMKADITFVPDVISSAGALIVGVTELVKGKAKAGLVDRIYDTTLKTLTEAKRRNIPPLMAAETLAAQALRR